jgi:LCP family protein required for cell wall assembly
MVEPVFRKPPPEGDGTEAPKPKRFWWRFLLGSLLIVCATATAVAAGGLIKIENIAEALGHNNKLRNAVEGVLKETKGGEAQNILIIGSDKRAGAEFAEDPGRSDTTMLLRLDPDNGAIALMSIPRDLKTEIPGYGTAKFNEAFTYGGPKLTLQTVKELTGLQINHVVNVDYLGFVRAVYAIGCVYVEIDRRYYHSNIGVPADEQYAEINVKPGYQLMCGKRALEYVRYRHTDTDLVRAARQQDFLAAARQRVPISDLARDVLGAGKLIDIFTEYTTSDISDTKSMVEVMKLFIASRNSEIKEVRFPATLGPSFVYATPTAIEGAVDQFLGIEASGGPRGSIERREDGGKKKKKKAKKEKPRVKPKPPGEDGLVDAVESGVVEAQAVARKVSHNFPVYYPTRLPPGASYEESNPYLKIVDPRVYHFKDTDEDRHSAYRMVIQLELADGLHYFGVQGIKGWADPPILSDPSETRTIAGREYDIFIDGDRVKRISWTRGENSYWVANDLLNTLTNDQMVGIARSAKVLIPNRKPKMRKGAASGAGA